MSSVADRMRRHRDRAKQGRIVVGFEIDECAWHDILTRAGLLNPNSDDRIALSAAMQKFAALVVKDQGGNER